MLEEFVHSLTYFHSSERTADDSTGQADNMAEQSKSEYSCMGNQWRILTSSRTTERQHPDHQEVENNAPKRQKKSTAFL